ncbi:MAG: hypothetical protein JXR75_08590 [Rhodobacteraceae bacterium]|nr:hypothetical protein [Paracoccaceae bacterium]
MHDIAFRYQYRISERTPTPTTSGGADQRVETIDGWTIELGVGLPLARLRRETGKPMGLVFGIAVDGNGALIAGEDYGAPDPCDGWDAVERWIEGINGRFGSVLSDGKEVRFYSDASGMIGAVYDPKTRRLASSLALCLDRPVQDRDDYDHAAVAERGALYTTLDTRDKAARRMNPSCYLSLNDFTETRFWPRLGSIKLVDEDLSKTYDWLAKRTQTVMSTIAQAHRTWLALSGGQDSRLLLALAGPAVQNLERSFTHVSNFMGRIDASIAARMAAQVGLDHEIHDRRRHKAVPEQVRKDEEAFLRSLGFPMRPSREISNGLIRRLPDGVVVFRGHQTDILRAVFSDKIGAKARRRTQWQIKRLMPVPRTEFDTSAFERFQGRYEAWRQALPPFAEANSTDLMFLEIYYSSTIGCSFPAMSRVFYMSPFNGRRQIGHAMAIDEAYRKSGFAVFDLIARCNPGLADIPFDFELGPDLAKLDDADHVSQAVQPRRASTQQRLARIA